MNLDYEVLWFEDDRRWYESVVPFLRDAIEEEGFNLLPKRFGDGRDLDGLLTNPDFDLIIMDFNLPGEHGDRLINRIRNHEVYTEIIFYSQRGELVVRDKMKEMAIDGVYCSSRERDLFVGKVTKVIKTTIKKVQDINNVRGLVMAETSALDSLMEDIIFRILAIDGSEEDKLAIKNKFIKSLNEKIKGIEKVDHMNDHETLIKRIEASHKWRAVKRLCSRDGRFSECMEELEKYESEVMAIRNILAHVKPSFSSEGKKILKSTLPGYETFVFNDDEAVKIRKCLMKHAENLKKIIQITGSS